MSTDPSLRRGLLLAAGSLAVAVALLAALVARGQEERVEPPPPEEPGAVGPEEPDADLPEDGEEDEPVLEGSYFASSVAASAGWQEGFLLGDEDEGDAVFRLTPRLLLVHQPSGRTELAVAYAPELEAFDRHSELDAVHHAGGALFRRDLTRRSRLLAGGSFLDGEDPTRQLGGVFVLLPRVPFREGRLYAGLEHRWQRTAVLLHVGRVRTEIDPAEGVLSAGVDRSEDTAAVTLVQTVTRRTDLSASYSYVDPETRGPSGGAGDGTGLVDLDDPIQTLTVGVGHRFNPRVALQVSGGVLEQNDDLSYVGAAELVRAGDPLSFHIRYDRSLLSLGAASRAGAGPGPGAPVQPGLPTAALGDTLTDSLGVAFLARLTDRVRWRQLVEGARTELPTGDTLETLGGSGRLMVEATRRLGTFLELDYFDQRGSDLFGPPSTRWTASLGLVVGLTGPPAAWGVREEPERLNAVLPDRTGAFDG